MKRRPTSWYLWKLMRYAPFICVLHAILWGMINASTLLYGVFISRLIADLETGANDRATIFALAFAGLGIGQAVLWLIAGRTELVMRFSVSSGVVRRNLLRMLLATPGAVALSHSVGDTLSRFRDDAYMAEDALDWTNEIVLQVLIACSALGVMLWIDTPLTLMTVIPTLAIILGARLAGGHLASLRRASSEATSRFTSTVGDVVAASLSIQAAGASDRTIHHIAGLAGDRRSATLKDRIVTQAVDGITWNASAIGTGLVMLFAASRIHEGKLSVAEFVLFTAWLGTVTNIAVDLGRYLAQMAAARVAFDRMEAIAERAPADMTIVDHTLLYLTGAIPELPAQPAPIHTQIDALSMAIAGQQIALPRGQMIAITGRIGSGKTRVLQSLLELDPAGEAAFLLDSAALDNVSEDLNIGYVPQVPKLFHGTVRENILLDRDVDEVSLHEALTLAALDYDLARFPDGLDTIVGARGLRVSGGQAQRIALTRALVTRPMLLVVDDLSSALDVDTERAVWSGLRSQPVLTILAVSHRRFVLEQADEIVVLRAGAVDACGPLDEVLANSSEMRTLWDEEET
ncbi:MAG: ABC transporter ATP-binding protein [Thermomicrobiales bacterium]|nr:ABC transporter ATP-binding protein [Thermomicrobiales bacterium]